MIIALRWLEQNPEKLNSLFAQIADSTYLSWYNDKSYNNLEVGTQLDESLSIRLVEIIGDQRLTRLGTCLWFEGCQIPSNLFLPNHCHINLTNSWYFNEISSSPSLIDVILPLPSHLGDELVRFRRSKYHSGDSTIWQLQTWTLR